jgi:putative transposase
MRYRRVDEKGGTYFFTVNLANRNGSLLVDAIDTLRNCMSLVMQHHPFSIDAIVVLPEHIHALWTLQEDDSD